MNKRNAAAAASCSPPEWDRGQRQQIEEKRVVTFSGRLPYILSYNLSKRADTVDESGQLLAILTHSAFVTLKWFHQCGPQAMQAPCCPGWQHCPAGVGCWVYIYYRVYVRASSHKKRCHIWFDFDDGKVSNPLLDEWATLMSWEFIIPLLSF